MKKTTCLLLMLAIFIFSGCSNQTDIPSTQPDAFTPIPNTNKLNPSTPTPIISNQDTFTPTPIMSNQDNTLDRNAQKKYYHFDASKDWDASEYEKKFGQTLNYFSAPIQSPYQYTYQCESKDMTIDEVALALGTIMMGDLMRDYEGKTFTVTEYQNLVSYVMDEAEYAEWEERYRNSTGTNVILEENQWLSTFDCAYKYTGVYANIGLMPVDQEWMNGLAMDGSGEDYVFLIQRVIDDEYIMRGLPKTIKEIRED